MRVILHQLISLEERRHRFVRGKINDGAVVRDALSEGARALAHLEFYAREYDSEVGKA
jgi:hypothetical protein